MNYVILDMKLFEYFRNSISKNENYLIESNLKVETKKTETNKNIAKEELTEVETSAGAAVATKSKTKESEFCFDNYAYGNSVLKQPLE